MNTGQTDKFHLKEIASWDKSIIPDLQRGLVWKPRQMELLWDSILRGFPIGSFIFAEAADGKDYLMDGQQRFNTISLGFKDPEEDGNPSCILWIDLEPKGKTSRKYWIKATTISHPWGYANNDDCSTLSAAQRREALSLYGIEGNIYQNPISLYDAWPSEAGFPVPLSCILNSDVEDENAFEKSLEANFRKARNKFKKLQSLGNEDIKQLTKQISSSYYTVVKRMYDYTVGYSKLSKEVFQDNTEDSVQNTSTALEVLFTRLNTGGTQITSEELFYSAIKSYWGEIKEINDELAGRYHVPAVKLAILSFRLYKTLQSGIYENDLSILKIRELATADVDDKSRIIEFYKTELEDVLADISAYFDDERIPAIIKTSLVRNSTDVFLLMMYLRKRHADLDASKALGLMLYLHWFAVDRHKRKAVKCIFDECVKEDDNVDVYASIQRGISNCLLNDWITFPVTPDTLRENIRSLCNPDQKFELPDSALWTDTFNVVTNNGSYSNEMLLLAQKDYINAKFPQYDPGNESMWQEHNRPWDFDHIIPQEWIAGRRRYGIYQGFCKNWLNNIGNFAAIPFELNRAKKNDNDFEEYTRDSEKLLFDWNKYKEIKENLIDDKQSAILFAETTADRMLEIYSRIYSLVQPVLDFEADRLCESAFKRKELFDKIREVFKDAVVSFVVNNKEYEIDEHDIINWNRDWMSIGIVRGSYYYCLTTSPHYINKEIGIRRAPEQMKTVMPGHRHIDGYIYDEDNPWWYCYKLIRTNDANILIDELSKLV